MTANTVSMKCSRQLFALLFFLVAFNGKAQPVRYNLVQMLHDGHFMTTKKVAPGNEARITEGTDRPAVSLQGNVWLKDVTFSNGRIDIDLRGKNIPGQSFIGVAFNGQTDSDYECLYFRPFNFENTDSLHRRHMVQYMSLPGHEWNVLRETQPLVFENTISPAPSATAWFHATIIADADSLRVYVNAAAKPSLRVKRFKNHKGEKFGLWCSDLPGDFANLVITKN
jgi:hypothetical protein